MAEEKRQPEEVNNKRHRGGQLGNQNARTHGFYSKVLTSAERRSLETAGEVEGLDDEIALLRVKIESLVKHDPDNVELITRAINSLTRMVIARYSLGQQDKGGLKQAILAVLKDIVLPAGVEIGKILKR
ncbi:MAG: hypothetical protein HY529_06115 [Chloroflexi bacterium]|nr:hypothetical protein [Chloroflexota bacterium]